MDDSDTVMGLLARRAGMTEGQLYTAVIAVGFALLLTLTGLPGAGRAAVGLPGISGPAPTLAPATTAPVATAPPTSAPAGDPAAP